MPSPGKIYPSYLNIHLFTRMMVHQMNAAGFVPRVIMPVAKGGLIPAALIHQAFPDAQYTFTRVSSYEGQEKKPGGHNISFPPKSDLFNQDHTLIVDDICDTGGTFNALHEHFPAAKYAALFLRDTGEELTFEPDFHGKVLTDDSWVVFPWELDFPQG